MFMIVNLTRKRQCILVGRCFIIDADEKRKNKLGRKKDLSSISKELSLILK